MKTRFYFSLFIIISSFYSCEKDNNYPPGGTPPLLQTNGFNIVSSHYWRISELYLRTISDPNGDNVLDTSFYNDFPNSCLVDNKYYFKMNGYMVTDDGADTCLAATDSVTWGMANNDTEIIIDSDHFQVENLTSSLFKISITTVNGPPTYIIDERVTMVYP